MAKNYRASISVPIVAASDEDAIRLAVEQMVGEVEEGSLQMLRVVDADPGLLTQLPADWKP